MHADNKNFVKNKKNVSNNNQKPAHPWVSWLFGIERNDPLSATAWQLSILRLFVYLWAASGQLS